jgi:hypothetical protein
MAAVPRILKRAFDSYKGDKALLTLSPLPSRRAPAVDELTADSMFAGSQNATGRAGKL